jgi:hypothetical protein
MKTETLNKKNKRTNNIYWFNGEIKNIQTFYKKNQNKKIREIKISIKGEVKNKFKVYKRNQDKNHIKKD